MCGVAGPDAVAAPGSKTAFGVSGIRYRVDERD
jgi:hypothetical protein